MEREQTTRTTVPIRTQRAGLVAGERNANEAGFAGEAKEAVTRQDVVDLDEYVAILISVPRQLLALLRCPGEEGGMVFKIGAGAHSQSNYRWPEAVGL